jgi:type IV pilus assembly protein PilM
MKLPAKFSQFFRTPMPELAFELSADGIAFTKPGSPVLQRASLPADAIQFHFARDNVREPQLLVETLRGLVHGDSQRLQPCALILPDHCGRSLVMDFDEWPGKEKERMDLLRFRLRKSLPFDVDHAQIGWSERTTGKGRTEIVAGVLSLDVLASWETCFRQAGLHAGFVTLSSLAMADLVDGPGCDIVLRLCGSLLSVAV